MARTGIYFSDVKRARDQLVAQGRRASIDAIRAALGDTGSKTTIHKYLRELEQEEDVGNRNVSDAILSLAAQLADQLQQEAGVEVAAVNEEMAQLRTLHAQELAAAAQQLAALHGELDALSARFVQSEQALVAVTAELQAQQIARHTAEQHSVDVGERLRDAQQHQASLEEKHRHARDALEHFRTAARDQREAETRRHGQQLQAAQVELRQAQQAAALRQEELTRLNKEAAALVAELAAGKQAAFLERETNRHLTRQVARLHAAESRVAVLEAQLADSRLRIAALDEAAVHAAQLAEAAQEKLQQQQQALEGERAKAALTGALEERLARLDAAVFGAAPQDGAAVETAPARVVPGKS